MSGFFFNLGKFIGPKLRQANWVYRSLTGTEAEAITAEHGIGRDLARAFLQQLEIETDPVCQQAVDTVGSRLAAALPRWPGRFHFLVVRAPEVNAFALPGGFIFLTRRLLDLCLENPSSLAFALGHEIGHVIRRHVIDRMMADTLIHGVLQRLPVGGAVLRPQVAAVLGTLLNKGYSREQELEADAIGLSLLRAAGFNPASAQSLLVLLAAGNAADPWLAGYFGSHPPLDVRLNHLDRCLRNP